MYCISLRHTFDLDILWPEVKNGIMCLAWISNYCWCNTLPTRRVQHQRSVCIL